MGNSNFLRIKLIEIDFHHLSANRFKLNCEQRDFRASWLLDWNDFLYFTKQWTRVGILHQAILFWQNNIELRTQHKCSLFLFATFAHNKQDHHRFWHRQEPRCSKTKEWINKVACHFQVAQAILVTGEGCVNWRQWMVPWGAHGVSQQDPLSGCNRCSEINGCRSRKKHLCNGCSSINSSGTFCLLFVGGCGKRCQWLGMQPWRLERLFPRGFQRLRSALNLSKVDGRMPPLQGSIPTRARQDIWKRAQPERLNIWKRGADTQESLGDHRSSWLLFFSGNWRNGDMATWIPLVDLVVFPLGLVFTACSPLVQPINCGELTQRQEAFQCISPGRPGKNKYRCGHKNAGTKYRGNKDNYVFFQMNLLPEIRFWQCLSTWSISTNLWQSRWHVSFFRKNPVHSFTRYDVYHVLIGYGVLMVDLLSTHRVAEVWC